MKLLFAIKGLSAAGGGAERVLASVSSAMAARGHEVTVLSYDAAASSDFYPLPNSVTRLRLGSGAVNRSASVAETISRIALLRRRIRERQPDVAIGFMHSMYLPLGVSLFGTSIPVIGSEHIVYQHYRSRPLQALLLRLAPRVCAALTAISEPMRESFPAPIRRKMTIIGNPVDTRDTVKADVVGGPCKTVLTVGRLEKQKDHATLIAAFGRIANQHPCWNLRIVGEGVLRSSLERQISRLGLERRIFLPGASSEVGREYARAQLFAISSTYESFGLVTAEAMAHGLPAIGFADCPGTNELIEAGRNGHLVSGYNRIQSLAAGLSGLMRDPAERQRLSHGALASVDDFSVDRIAVEWERLIQRVHREVRDAS